MGYNKLEAENEKTIAALKSIIEERDKERASEAKREKEYTIIDKDIRDFCKSILSKRDMNSGKDPADILKDSLIYDSMPTKKLIAETKKAREEYDEGRIDLMRQLHNENSSLKKEKNNLEEHYRINKEALTGSAEEKKQLKKNIARLQDKVGKLVGELKQVEVSPIPLTKKDTERKALLTEESKNLETKKRINDVKLSKQEQEIEELTTNILQNPQKESKEEKARAILKIIGDTGLSIRVDIEEALRAKFKNKVKDVEETFKTSALNAAFTFLVEKGLLGKDSFSTFEGKTTYYVMSNLGNKVFYNIEKREAKEAEMAKVTATHSSKEHGYGILKLAKIMRAYPKRFSEISEYNKGKQGVNLTTHIMRENEEGDMVSKEVHIEPDIAFDEDFEQRYIEYELVSQSKAEYFEKFDKYISRGVKMLIYIFPSEKVRREFLRYVTSYKEEKEEEGILYDVNFYLYTIAEFKEMCEKGETWKPYKFKEDNEDDEKITEYTDRKDEEKEEVSKDVVEAKKSVFRSSRNRTPIKNTSPAIPSEIKGKE